LPADIAASRKLLGVSSTFMQRLGDEYNAGKLSLSDLNIAMREELRRGHALQLIAGKGGDKGAVSADDWLALGSVLKRQYAYLSRLSQQIESGEVGEGDLTRRAQLFARSARESYWRSATSGASLPAYPGDGSTDCVTNCDCDWEQHEDGWHWIQHTSESCPTCTDRGAKWKPYSA
jgi:hypothetical protein